MCLDISCTTTPTTGLKVTQSSEGDVTRSALEEMEGAIAALNNGDSVLAKSQLRKSMSEVSALAEAGASLEQVVRAHYYVTDQSYGEDVFKLVGSYFADIRPAATMVVCKLLNDDMKVEIEVTAQIE